MTGLARGLDDASCFVFFMTEPGDVVNVVLDVSVSHLMRDTEYILYSKCRRLQ